jgi:hypothetical protein
MDSFRGKVVVITDTESDGNSVEIHPHDIIQT